MSLFGFLFGCGTPKETVLYSADCNGAELRFSAKEKSHYATIKCWMEIKIGKLPPVKISDNEVLDQTPYSFDILKGYPYFLYDTTDKTAPFGDVITDRKKMLVFIHPDKYSKADFETMHNCLSQHFGQIEDALYEKYIANREHFNFPQFAGIIYADINSLTEQYNNPDNSKRISVPFSGSVTMEEEEDGMKVTSGLGRVTMKQKDLTAQYEPKLDISAFRNMKTGKVLSDDYSFYTDKDNRIFWIKK